MKILIISDGDSKYGAANSLCQMAARLQLKDDIDLTVVLNHESNVSDFLKAHACKVIILPYELYCHAYPSKFWKLLIKKPLYAIKYYLSRLLALKKLQEKIDIERFDLIHSNGNREDFSALISERFNIPLVWHLREFDDLGYKCFYLRNDYVQLMNRTANVLIAVSDAVMKNWINKGIDEKKIVRVYNGVKMRKSFRSRLIPLAQKKEIKVIMVGSLQPLKGQMQAIELMASLKESNQTYCLDFIGDGSSKYVNQLKNEIKKNKIEENIRFLGYRTDVFQLLLDYDIGLTCSKDEGFGRVTAEYMMAGLPVLASNTGANSELIRDGIDGYLYSYGNIQDMKNKLVRIINNNLGGMETYKYATANFSDIVNADNIYQIYKKVLQDT